MANSGSRKKPHFDRPKVSVNLQLTMTQSRFVRSVAYVNHIRICDTRNVVLVESSPDAELVLPPSAVSGFSPIRSSSSLHKSTMLLECRRIEETRLNTFKPFIICNILSSVFIKMSFLKGIMYK